MARWLCAFFGIIHSPLPDEQIDLPWRVLTQVPQEFQTAVQYQTPYHWAAAYGLVAAMLVGLSYSYSKEEKTSEGIVNTGQV